MRRKYGKRVVGNGDDGSFSCGRGSGGFGNSKKV